MLLSSEFRASRVSGFRSGGAPLGHGSLFSWVLRGGVWGLGLRA